MSLWIILGGCLGLAFGYRYAVDSPSIPMANVLPFTFFAMVIGGVAGSFVATKLLGESKK
jgi:hypothetical protein